MTGRVIHDEEIKARYAGQEPYGEWLDTNLVNLSDLKIPNEKVPAYGREERARLQKAFGYTYEEYRESICSMALNGTERIGAMGVDTPLAVLSRLPIRPSMRCGRKSSLPPPCTWAKTEICWRRNRKTVKC